MSASISLYDLTFDALEALLLDLGQPRFRAGQVWHWLYRHLAPSVEDMTTLPLALRRELSAMTRIHTMSPVTRTVSEDRMTTKFLFRMSDGQFIETVLMHYIDPADADDPDQDAVPRHRHSVCLSTQAGCAMGCAFCATGQMGLMRDLTLGECVEQIVYCARLLDRTGERIGNVVFMGMGEPLANWPATWGTVNTLTRADGFGLSARRLTVSTVGLVPGIRRLAATDKPVRLAVSIHAPDDELRDRLVPVNRKYPLAEVLEACRDFQAGGGRRVTFEYVLIRGINDRPHHAARLAALLRGLRAHVNLIPLNPTAGNRWRPPRERDVTEFARVLRDMGLCSTSRMRRGIDIEAGCGQLRTRVLSGCVGRTIPEAKALA